MGGSALRAIDWTSGLQTVVVGNAADHAIIGHADQDHAAGGIGKGAYLTSKPGSARALELDGEAFAKGGQVREGLFVSCWASSVIMPGDRR